MFAAEVKLIIMLEVSSLTEEELVGLNPPQTGSEGVQSAKSFKELLDLFIVMIS